MTMNSSIFRLGLLLFVTNAVLEVSGQGGVVFRKVEESDLDCNERLSCTKFDLKTVCFCGDPDKLLLQDKIDQEDCDTEEDETYIKEICFEDQSSPQCVSKCVPSDLERTDEPSRLNRCIYFCTIGSDPNLQCDWECPEELETDDITCDDPSFVYNEVPVLLRGLKGLKGPKPAKTSKDSKQSKKSKGENTSDFSSLRSTTKITCADIGTLEMVDKKEICEIEQDGKVIGESCPQACYGTPCIEDPVSPATFECPKFVEGFEYEGLLLLGLATRNGCPSGYRDEICSYEADVLDPRTGEIEALSLTYECNNVTDPDLDYLGKVNSSPLGQDYKCPSTFNLTDTDQKLEDVLETECEKMAGFGCFYLISGGGQSYTCEAGTGTLRSFGASNQC